MIRILLYHHIAHPLSPYSISLKKFEKHLRFLKENYSFTLPGEPSQKKNELCLTFDDAYFDFYHYAYPLLKKMQIPFVLAIPTKYILEHSDLSPATRLAHQKTDLFKNYKKQASFCTWEEINKMASETALCLASHTHSHIDMTSSNIDIQTELSHSQALIESHTRQKCDCFVYPFGKCNNSIHSQVMEHYQWAMRIGSAINLSWQSRLLYRIVVNESKPIEELFRSAQSLTYLLSFFFNKMRNK